jgi:protein-S-isoprenylcysteine O-methyltransferase Ste14
MHNGVVLGLLLTVGGIAVWLMPFLWAKRGAGRLAAIDRRARWGLVLEVMALGLVLQSRFWTVNVISWRIVSSVTFFLLAALLSWSSTKALGRNLRFDAAIGMDHALVRSGPYRVIRHPIYCSMLCLLWGIGSLAAPAWLFILATLLFVAGTEIRVHIEDQLLARRFGQSFVRYKHSTRAYLPLLR